MSLDNSAKASVKVVVNRLKKYLKLFTYYKFLVFTTKIKIEADQQAKLANKKREKIVGMSLTLGCVFFRKLFLRGAWCSG